MPVEPAETVAQRDYYRATAQAYDGMHGLEAEEHEVAFALLSGLIRRYGFSSLLDIGSGTGRVLIQVKADHPDIAVTGIEPVDALRAVGHAKGLSADELRDGNALSLDLPDNSVDLVCAFAVLHHIKDHAQAVREMVRVARHGVFLSDANNFGQGSAMVRMVKRGCHALGLWPLLDWVMTRGKGYHWSEGDGIFYSYSVTRDIDLLRAKFSRVHMMNTLPMSGLDLYRGAPHMAVFATNASLQPDEGPVQTP